MSPEERKLLEETHALAKDTHRVIREMRREQWFAFFFKIIVWIIVIILPVYFFAEYLTPVIQQMTPPGQTAHWTGWFGLPSSADIQNLINSYKVKQ